MKKLCSREGTQREESVCGITDIALSERRNGNFRMWLFGVLDEDFCVLQKIFKRNATKGINEQILCEALGQ